MEYGFGQKELDRVESILQNDLIAIGVTCAILIDMAGNVIARCDNGQCNLDLYSLAALAAGNFGARRRTVRRRPIRCRAGSCPTGRAPRRG